MNNNRLIPLRKVWTKEGKYAGEKEHWFNPEFPVRGIEPCKINKDGKEIECTKIFYKDGIFITIIGDPETFFNACREANTAVGLLFELNRNGLSIKDFLKQCERFNNIELI